MATKMEARVEASKALGKENAALKTTLEIRHKIKDEEVKQLEERLAKMTALRSENEELKRKIRGHGDILSTSFRVSCCCYRYWPSLLAGY